MPVNSALLQELFTGFVFQDMFSGSLPGRVEQLYVSSYNTYTYKPYTRRSLRQLSSAINWSDYIHVERIVNAQTGYSFSFGWVILMNHELRIQYWIVHVSFEIH